MARKRSGKSSKASTKKGGRGRGRGARAAAPSLLCDGRARRAAAAAGALAVLAVAAYYNRASSSSSSSSSGDRPAGGPNDNAARKEAFLKWFVDGGGTFHPVSLGDGKFANVTMEEFPAYGGWGLALPVPPGSSPRKDESDGSDECPSSGTDPDGQLLCPASRDATPIVRHLDPLFTVPSSLILSVDSVVAFYASSPSSPMILLNKILMRSFPNSPGLARRGMGLVPQDIVIAVHLAAEECRRRHPDTFEGGSDWGPYLDVLPRGAVPRLDTFGDEAYAALDDEKLERDGRNSKRLLRQMFDGGSGSKGPTLRKVVQAAIRQRNGPVSSPLEVPEDCLTFEAFHRFVGVVSSRAMVLRGVKHLTPLAEMINYAPKALTRRGGEGEDRIRAPFDLYHHLADDGSITVRSDRDVFLPAAQPGGGDGAAAIIQLFEDYGPVDSSLFLEAHGFVPAENPNHCATVAGASFLRSGTAAGRKDENADLVLRALKALRLVRPEAREFDALEDVCVRKNLEIVDDGKTVGRRPASDSVAIVSLLLGNADGAENDRGETFVSAREECVTAVRSGDAERVELRCARYPGSDGVVRRALRAAARRSVEGFDDENGADELLSQLQRAEEQGSDRLAVALRFRMEERKILQHIARSVDEMPLGEVKEDVNSRAPEDLESKLVAFDSFVESLELPLNKIEPKLVGNGMRVGTCAKEDLEVGDAYISLPANAVIDVTTAIASVDEASDLANLLRKHSESNPQHNDGFDALLLYLLHEKFILEEKSRWRPYLNLLPSIEDLGAFHPLFFREEEINRYLAGSDVRKFILRYQQRAAERHAGLSSDLDAILVLGSDVLLDKRKVYWATAILDSRSIWWDSKRHLAPLLDLVNADNEGYAHETRLEDSEETEQKVAVTRASRRVGKGEQVFENYAQPNYLLFAYHGFLLVEENPNDCALLDGLFVHRDDPGAKSVHLLRSRAPTFCIRDLASVEELAEFLRVKHGLAAKNIPGSAVDDDVRPYLAEILEERVARLEEALGVDIDAERLSLPRLRFMRQIVKNDLMHFQHALNLLG